MPHTASGPLLLNFCRIIRKPTVGVLAASSFCWLVSWHDCIGNGRVLREVVAQRHWRQHHRRRFLCGHGRRIDRGRSRTLGTDRVRGLGRVGRPGYSRSTVKDLGRRHRVQHVEVSIFVVHVFSSPRIVHCMRCQRLRSFGRISHVGGLGHGHALMRDLGRRPRDCRLVHIAIITIVPPIPRWESFAPYYFDYRRKVGGRWVDTKERLQPRLCGDLCENTTGDDLVSKRAAKGGGASSDSARLDDSHEIAIHSLKLPQALWRNSSSIAWRSRPEERRGSSLGGSKAYPLTRTLSRQ